MAELMLPTPMRIRPHGSDTIRDIATLKDASEILIDWPQAKRGPFYQAAREQVEAALENKAGAAQAQEAFAALCDHAGVLVR
ncbi:MAG: DUF982 domain-containing protein [Mesorhizobium sp.]|uniref:DUF982 domain-containing protein n=1 Tax=Mesorhizobium sp. TaxID=1871066 RepID=UPI000FE837E5|nr:DUF982 domain-containing protein [Mesorhizobium sp.]RWC25525.1 MAG: DUF982 domain-containing protein [Mesorhizobium sp.]RWC46758.1 MAG: DUF982 domain-containing protein [Mesorhizobium sp.]TIW89981.1 MAG: DUF982 domain-containing protein [Mesorhizobium sp.]TIX24293.1 MAG: DUF982 domain-containing protein [Mesorhizobium sp.]